MPISPVDVQHTLLKHFAHGHQQAWPSQIVVLRSETLSLCNILKSDYWNSLKWVVLSLSSPLPTSVSKHLYINRTTCQIEGYQNPNFRLLHNCPSQLYFLDLYVSWSKWHVNNIKLKYNALKSKDIHPLLVSRFLFKSSQQMESITIHTYTKIHPSKILKMVKMSLWSRKEAKYKENAEPGRNGRLSYFNEITEGAHNAIPWSWKQRETVGEGSQHLSGLMLIPGNHLWPLSHTRKGRRLLAPLRLFLVLLSSSQRCTFGWILQTDFISRNIQVSLFPVYAQHIKAHSMCSSLPKTTLLQQQHHI